jgi:hypothetical protein
VEVCSKFLKRGNRCSARRHKVLLVDVSSTAIKVQQYTLDLLMT